MILHILGNHCYRRHLGSINGTLALTEDDCRLQHVIVHHLRHLLDNGSGLHLSSLIKRIVQFTDGAGITCQRLLLLLVLIAQFVELLVQHVGLILVMYVYPYKIVSTIAVREFVVNAKRQCHTRVL